MSELATGRARLRLYVPWMLRDYFTNQGASTAIVLLLIGYLTILPFIEQQAALVRLGDAPQAVAERMLRALVAPLVYLGTFFATNGIIANDRKFGYYRFLFAKPVHPPAYYALTFAAYGAGLLAVTAVLLGVWSLVVRPMFPWELFAVVALMYVAFGGIGFLLSAAWRFDWLSLVTVLLVANVAWTLWADAGGLRGTLLYLLPPVHRASEVYALVGASASAPVPWDTIAWLGGYGLVCFLAGVVVVRRRPLGTS